MGWNPHPGTSRAGQPIQVQQQRPERSQRCLKGTNRSTELELVLQRRDEPNGQISRSEHRSLGFDNATFRLSKKLAQILPPDSIAIIHAANGEWRPSGRIRQRITHTPVQAMPPPPPPPPRIHPEPEGASLRLRVSPQVGASSTRGCTRVPAQTRPGPSSCSAHRASCAGPAGLRGRPGLCPASRRTSPHGPPRRYRRRPAPP